LVKEYVPMAAQPVEQILARNLVSGITLATFLVDPDGMLIFFNDAAGQLIGRRFEEVGRLRREEWNSEFGPFDEFGKLMPTENMPLTVALREGLPAHDRFHISAAGESLVEVDVSALPLATADGFKGAIVVFWRSDTGEHP
jgi:PAS domain-containing protein